MRKIIIIIAIALIGLGIYLLIAKDSSNENSDKAKTEAKHKNTSSRSAAEDAKHFDFKGVTLYGDPEDFVEELEKQGFSSIGRDGDIYFMKGDFAGYYDCEVAILSTKSTGEVCTVVVQFPECEKWNELQENYNDLKSMLTQKYGEPTRVVEEFNDRYAAMGGDRSKFHAVLDGECTWFSEFETPKGKVQVGLEKTSIIRNSVKMWYIDKLNGDVANQDAMDDL